MAAEVSLSSGSSDTSSTGEEERVKRLFQTCDGDGDGYISRNDLLMVCRQLNMEGSVAEIMDQLGADEEGRISFEDFMCCRMRLVNEIRKEEGELSLRSGDLDRKEFQEPVSFWPSSTENILVALSRTRDSWDCDTGVRDLQSSALQQQPFQQHGVSQKLLEQRGAALEQQAALHKLLMQSPSRAPPLGANYLELANM